MRTRVSETLTLERGSICCGSCGHKLAPSGTSWKKNAALSTIAVKELPGAASAIDTRVVLRRFACPACAFLLDTETALPEDPFLEDVLTDGHS